MNTVRNGEGSRSETTQSALRGFQQGARLAHKGLHGMRFVHAVDAHTQGAPVRVLVSGLPPLSGATVKEKRDFFRTRYDALRSAWINEPRGHGDMFGAVLLPPTSPDADLATFFIDTGGYLDMCGHGLIGLVTVAATLGWLKSGGRDQIRCETPAGIVTCWVRRRDGMSATVAFENVPAYPLLLGATVEVPGLTSKAVRLDVSYGGNYTALVDAAQLGLSLEKACVNDLISAGMNILKALNLGIEAGDPLLKDVPRIDLVELTGPSLSPDADARNMVVFGNGQADRSPCGTGTCARMVVLHARGELQIGQVFRHEGIVGTVFSGKLMRRAARPDALIPEIEGQAWITSFQQLVTDASDPFRHGFSLRPAHS